MKYVCYIVTKTLSTLSRFSNIIRRIYSLDVN